jgi:subtilisin-like proprotein convertase family protein
MTQRHRSTLAVSAALLAALCLRGDSGGRVAAQQSLSTDPPTLLANTLVNNPALDTSVQDTQSGTSITLAAGNVIVAYNNSRLFGAGSKHFTGWSTSSNGGTTWTDRGALPNSAAGDAGYPSLAYDPVRGRAYLSTLCSTPNDCLQVFRSDDNGVTWSAPVNPANGLPPSPILDKPWIAVDNATGTGQGYVYLIYRNFGLWGGVLMSRSTDGGTSWDPALLLRANVGNGGWVTVGPDHAVYAFWFEQTGTIIKMRKSTDFGVSFGPEVNVADVITTGLNGDLALNGGFRTNAFPQAVVNPVNGHLYVIYNDKTSGTDKANIYFRMSTDGGSSWSTALMLNDDVTTNDQFFPTLAVTPDGSRVFAAWYDRRHDPTNSRIERWSVIGAVSGSTVTWGMNFPISTGSFPVIRGQDPGLHFTYMGDYDHAAADNNYFYAPWADNRLNTGVHANQPDVRFERIPVSGPGAILLYGSSSLDKLDPAACNSLYVTLKNPGTAPATGVSAVLSTAAPNVMIEQATANYPTVAANGGVATNSTPFRIRFTSGFVCATNVPLTLALTSGSESSSLTFTLGTSFVPKPPNEFHNNTSIAIPDNDSTESQMLVSGLTGSIAKVRLSFHATHAFDEDLDIFLVGPDNTKVELTTDNGGSGDNYGSSCGPQTSRTTFDDDARTSIVAGTVPFVGTFRPEESLVAFAGKTGSAANGTWRLRIIDDEKGDIGVLNCWSLFITTTNCTVGGSCSTETRRVSDVDGDRRSDVTVFRPSSGTWFSLSSNSSYSSFVSPTWGVSTDLPVPGDYDGDQKTDFAIYRPSTGAWFIKYSSTGYSTSSAYLWGESTDLPVPGDYDGDGKTDLAVYRPSLGAWFILKSTTTFTGFDFYYWGLSTDIPVPADYDGDGKVDIAIYRPSTGAWFIGHSTANYTTSSAHVWGLASDVVVPGDYDGDGRADIAVYRPSAGAWYIRWSSTNFTSFSHFIWGSSTDTPMPADYDGDGRLDLAFYRPSSGGWYVLPSSVGYSTYFVVTWGAPGDVPVVY